MHTHIQNNRLNTILVFCVTLLLCLSTAAPVLQAASPASGESKNEAEFIRILKSDAGLKEKCDACRLLARIGTEKAVPVLASLLGDAKLSHMVRYALEPNPSPAVDRALFKALGEVKGLQRAGVIGSLGVRKHLPATDALIKLLASDDNMIAQAAARALGSFGTVEAAKALEAALENSTQENRLSVIEGLLRCAEHLAKGDDRERALEIYDGLRDLSDAAQQVRTAALRGAILVREKSDAIELIVEAVKSRDLVMANAAVRATMEMPGGAVTKALADTAGKLRSANQVLVVKALGERGDKAALPALFDLAEKGSTVSRVAVINAFTEMGENAAFPVLVKMLSDSSKEVSAAAQNALAGMGGQKVDAAVTAMLKEQDPQVRAAVISLIARRIAVGSMDGRKLFPRLVTLLAKAESDAEIETLEKLLSDLCQRYTVPQEGEVVIRKAVYGDLPDGKQADVTKKVRGIVKKGSLAIAATNANFGDPAQGTPKKLKVDYTVKGIDKTKTVGENDTIRINAGTTPEAFINALEKGAQQAGKDAKATLKRLLKSAQK